MDEISTSELASKVQEAYTTHVENLHDRLTQRVRTFASKARAFTREHRWFTEQNPYYWVLENHFPEVNVTSLTEEGVAVPLGVEKENTEVFITWEEVDNIDMILKERYSEWSAMTVEREKSWKAARRAELLQELSQLEETA